MSEENKDDWTGWPERRNGKDRRNGDMDELYRRLVEKGIFQDMRKGDRRKDQDPQKPRGFKPMPVPIPKEWEGEAIKKLNN